MPKKAVRSKEELLADLKKQEEQKREERKKCKNCGHGFYKSFEATENFPEATEYCGCRIKCSLVDPNGCCEAFMF